MVLPRGARASIAPSSSALVDGPHRVWPPNAPVGSELVEDWTPVYKLAEDQLLATTQTIDLCKSAAAALARLKKKAGSKK